MDKYYYVSAQLPLLQFGQPAFVTSQAFLEEARKWLSEDDFLRLVGSAANESFARLPGPVVQYHAFYTHLRRELGALRLARRQKKAAKVSSEVQEIVGVGTPLDVEQKLLRLRWDFIEDVSVGHYYDITFVIFYYLKLLILEEGLSFDKQAGRQQFAQACHVTYE